MAFLDLTTLLFIIYTLLVIIMTLVFLDFKNRNMMECVPGLLPSLRPTDSHQIVPFDTSNNNTPGPQIKYDIFISFRGSDTRRSFLSHLLEVLKRKGVETYVDYKLREGDKLSSSFFTAIEQSQIALVILSKNYASSKWCLEELTKIIECKEKYGQIVIPIFHEVDPSDLRHQKGRYRNAFAKHEKRFNITDVEKWRSALKDVANLSGFHSTHFGTDAKLIEKVVQRVLNRLNHMQQFDSHGLIGISKPIADLQSLIFCNGTKDVRVIGIWGMGGMGKTTIAHALFQTLCSEYESCYFLENVKEQIEKYGMAQLQTKFLSILLEEKDPDGTLADFLRRLRRKQVLVVLDDVINPDDVRELVGGRGQDCWLGPGSRIIVTTRDKHVLRKEADYIYQVKALGFEEALQLLTLHAFDGNDIPERYNDVVVEIVKYAKGVPLALKVLGSFLYGKSVEEWRSQLEKLKKMPFEGIQKVLRLSYDGLDREEKKILLYIACFFTCEYAGYSLEDVKMLLDACGFSTTIALTTLHDRCLITTHSTWGKYEVHDLIRQMCQEIVCEEKVEKPGERHHLWDPNDIYHVLKYDKGTDSIESISFDTSLINDLNLSPYSFARMVNLKFFKIYKGLPFSMHDVFNNSVHAREDHIILPNNLRLLYWNFCPFKYLQPAGLENLVELHMGWSRLEKLWDGTQNLPNLRKVYLGWSYQLKEVPDLSKALRLEELNLMSCENLVLVQPSIFYFPKLVKLKMRDCRRLENLPDLSKALSLEELDLESCENLVSVHPSVFSLPNLIILNMSYCERLESIPDLSKALRLEQLHLQLCKNLVSVHPSVFSLQKLIILNMSYCERLESLPGVLDEEASASGSASLSGSSSSSNLQGLNLSGCVSLKHLPDTFYKLTSLQELNLRGCKELDTSNLHILFDGLSSLTSLDMSGCDKLYEVPDNITNLSLLLRLSLDETNVKSMPESIKHLPQLKRLSLCNCKKLESLPQIPPSLQVLYLHNCILLERVFTPTPQLYQQHFAHYQSLLEESGPYRSTPFKSVKISFSLYDCPKLEKDAIDAVLKYAECCERKRNFVHGLFQSLSLNPPVLVSQSQSLSQRHVELFYFGKFYYENIIAIFQ